MVIVIRKMKITKAVTIMIETVMAMETTLTMMLMKLAAVGVEADDNSDEDFERLFSIP